MTGKLHDITWLSTKRDYWPPSGRGEMCGIACLLFGVGTAGVGWLARLAHSGWFTGLEPRTEDLTVVGSRPNGSWATPYSSHPGENGHLTKAAEAFFTSAPLPSAWYATVAITCEAGPDERSAVLGLIVALRKRRDPSGRRLTVVATIETAQDPSDGPFVQRLLECGAFVIRAALDALLASSDHLHHFPLRAAVIPHQGQLIGVDFADYLHTWQPGSVGNLYVVPFVDSDHEPTLCGLPLAKASGKARALNIGFNLDLCAPGKPLAKIDRFSTRCCELLLRSDGSVVFTNTDRLDRKVGLADVLVIYDGAAADE